MKRKFNDEHEKEIIEKYLTTEISIKGLARELEVSEGCITSLLKRNSIATKPRKLRDPEEKRLANNAYWREYRRTHPEQIKATTLKRRLRKQEYDKIHGKWRNYILDKPTVNLR